MYIQYYIYFVTFLKKETRINLFSLYFFQDKDGKITRKEIEELVKTLGGDTDCPHVQVSNIL